MEPSNAIELKVLGAKPYPDAIFGLEYAFAHGFARVDLNGSTYRQLSPGVVMRSEQALPLPPYVVVMDQRVAPWVPESFRVLLSSQSLHLVDRTSGNQLASFSLPSDGWPGDQAGRWLASLLNPDPFGKRSQQFDVSELASVEAISPSSVLQPEDVGIRSSPVKGCPKGIFAHYEKNSNHGRGELRTPNWTLLMPDGFREVHCLRRGIVLLGAYRQEDLELIAMDNDGTLIGRGFVRNDKVNLGNRYHTTKIVSLEETSEKLVVREAYFIAQSPPRLAAVADYEVKFNIPWSSVAIPR